MLKKHVKLEPHHHLSITFFAVILALVPVLIIFYSLFNNTSFLLASSLSHCPALKAPRDRTCPTSWVVARDSHNCRAFVCQK